MASQLLRLLGEEDYQPLPKVDLSKALGLPADDRGDLRRVLDDLEREGKIARVRKDRYILPAIADLVTGVIQIHARGSAHLLSKTPGEDDVFISGENTDTAMNGDTVLVRLMHEGAAQRGQERKLEGRVVRILERKNPTIVGTLQKTAKNFFYVIPDDSRLTQDVYVHPGEVTLPRRPEVGDKVVVKLEPWESRHVNPEGEIIEVIGPAGDPGVDIISIIKRHRLPTEFPPGVVAEAEKIEERVHPNELAQRQDLRDQMIVTIDPDDAKDFDDAIQVERTKSGWRLGVHIADVSHYVRPGSRLDKEAYERGNSVYLVDRVLPMLPEALSNGICSLRPEVERLVFSAHIEFDRVGQPTRWRFDRSVIRSQRRYTYKEAFQDLRKPPTDPLSQHLHTAWDLASVLRQRRFAAGSLDLDFPEVKVWLDEDKRPIRLEKIENDISHQLIEEFMLAANEAVAYETKSKKAAAVYRIHEDPDPDKLAEYRELVQSYQIKIGDLTKRAELTALLQKIKGRPDEYALKLGLLKSLKRATYDVSPVGHYGLAKVNYTHFTSPIRRYADLVVHRVLAGIIDPGKKGTPTSVDLPEVAEHISTTERTAAEAERESVKLKKLEYFQLQLDEKNPEAFPAVIVDVRSYGMLVELPDFVLTGLIHVSALNDDFYIFDPVRLRFQGKRTRRSFAIGEPLEVMVARVDTYKQQVDFYPAPPEPEPKKKRGR